MAEEGMKGDEENYLLRASANYNLHHLLNKRPSKRNCNGQ
jgi:hypothetical protein